MTRVPRPYIGMLFRCCKIYLRIYLNREQTAYVGHCPQCAKRVEIKVAPHGSHSRFWSAR